MIMFGTLMIILISAGPGSLDVQDSDDVKPANCQAADDSATPAKEAAAEAPAKEAATETLSAPEVKKKSKKKKRHRYRCRTKTSPEYKKMVRNWRKVPRIPKPRWRAGYRDLTMYSVNLGERIRVFPFEPDGSLDPEAVAQIEHLMRDQHTHATHPIHPRLIKLLYKLADRFKARQINVISGYRESRKSGTESHHTDGTAVDIMLPGIKLPAVAKVARRFGHVGVGYYPTSGFIHLDVRDKRSYFWADRSGPGQPGCLRQIMRKSAFQFDAKWRPKHDEPKLRRNKKGKLLGALPEDEPPEEGEEPSTDAGPDDGSQEPKK